MEEYRRLNFPKKRDYMLEAMQIIVHDREKAKKLLDDNYPEEDAKLMYKHILIGLGLGNN